MVWAVAASSGTLGEALRRVSWYISMVNVSAALK
jgi:hypothetical protein